MWRLDGHEMLRSCLDYLVSGMIETLGNADQPGSDQFRPGVSYTEVGTYRRPAQMEFAIDVLTGRLTMVEGWRPAIAGTSLLEP
ncbi:hypothetical protein AnigIFM56816_000333 [Aspergillus niger]|uniref:Contig An16c0160, genomic contig n=2 Tax=Aspergillus niger TaxID=5061 RepID=A2R7P3_ASPNC|nr:uncharacterized protein An16g04240 [Aspergillus niger]GKZ75674.1 hypothetical protein AnigIFM56816_000333 [Aspergillus niger]GKZ95842.1 hypothetical protein AnigIFM59636_009851 [Aspergillus niger]CAK46841.1 unnamed protein product [Aspergillus niger]